MDGPLGDLPAMADGIRRGVLRDTRVLDASRRRIRRLVPHRDLAEAAGTTTLRALRGSMARLSRVELVDLIADAAAELERHHLQRGQFVPYRVVIARHVLVDADLSVAKLTDLARVVQFVARFGVPVECVAPEGYGGDVADRASDVFAFGALMYEVLLGMTPWGDGADPEAVRRLVLAGSRPPLPPPPLIDPELAALIEDCWRAHPRDRPTMGSVQWRLSDWIARRTIMDDFHEPIGQAIVSRIANYVTAQTADALFVDHDPVNDEPGGGGAAGGAAAAGHG